MSILIKGMELPISCSVCQLRFYDGYTDCCPFVGDSLFLNQRSDYCPLVSVPKHGRLIDADALFAKIPSGDIEHDERISRCKAIADVCTWVLSAPTIIEAEGVGGRP